MTTTLRSGELAERAGVNLETIRYYERRGILPKPTRLASGYRVYAEDAVQRLRFIKHAQSLGFTLKEIKELLALRTSPKSNSACIQKQAQTKLEDITQKIRSLTRMKKTLERLSTSCSGRGPTSECPILEALEKEEF